MKRGHPLILLQLHESVEEFVDIGHMRGYHFSVGKRTGVWGFIRRRI